MEVFIWGEPRQIFLSENLSENIFANQLECKNALRVKKYIKEYIDPELYRNASKRNEIQLYLNTA